MTYKEIKTIKGRTAFVRTQLQTSDKWLFRGLMAIHDRQTADEQVDRITKLENGVGFTGTDAKFLTGMAAAYKMNRVFTPKMLDMTRKAMLKYAGQLVKIADGKI